MEELHSTTRIRFHGVATYEILSRDGRRILCDPFISDNPAATVAWDSFERVDVVIVSHAAPDHLGDTDKLAIRYACPVVCGGEVKAWLMDRGVPASQIRATTWGIRVKVADFEIQPVECHHWSQIRLSDGSFISGVPFAYIVYVDENVRFYHYGDTALFSDLKLQAELYRPTIGCIGIANPKEILHRFPMPGTLMTAELSPREGVLAAEWLGLETVLPCHYCVPDDDEDVDEFIRHYRAAIDRGARMGEVLVLRSGDWIELDPEGRLVRDNPAFESSHPGSSEP